MKNFVRVSGVLMVFLLTVSFMPYLAGAAEKTPAEVGAVAAKAKGIAENSVKKLNGAWGDQHVALVASKKGKEFADYESMRTVLKGLVAESGAPYIYALTPKGAVDKEPFIISVDGSETDDCGKENEWEAGFTAAWKGAATAGTEAWKDDDGTPMVSAYAPILDSKGNVVAILGVDCPIP
jgi:hypothetical protein